ncbi:hypothetical protein VTH06DRAFT_852 [Thermothelomyces fergusii]
METDWRAELQYRHAPLCLILQRPMPYDHPRPPHTHMPPLPFRRVLAVEFAVAFSTDKKVAGCNKTAAGDVERSYPPSDFSTP